MLDELGALLPVRLSGACETVSLLKYVARHERITAQNTTETS